MTPTCRITAIPGEGSNPRIERDSLGELAVPEHAY